MRTTWSGSGWNSGDGTDLTQAFESIIKVYTVAASPNWFMPWQTKQQRESTGSGFIVSGKRIITNAHCVADQAHVIVRKHGDPKKYTARVVAVGHECDLALLTTDAPEFWEGTTPLELGGIPNLQDPVAVVGYPTGGDNISVSVGVVSRVEPQVNCDCRRLHASGVLIGIFSPFCVRECPSVGLCTETGTEGHWAQKRP
jgi:S1-C subfamily serine protease